MKDFDQWNNIKKETHKRITDDVYFKEREVWWVRLGVNIGFEQDGTGEQYARPVVVIKKYNPEVFLIVPLSTTGKRGKYYFSIGNIDGKEAVAILSPDTIDRCASLGQTHRYYREEAVFFTSECGCGSKLW